MFRAYIYTHEKFLKRPLKNLWVLQLRETKMHHNALYIPVLLREPQPLLLLWRKLGCCWNSSMEA